MKLFAAAHSEAVYERQFDFDPSHTAIPASGKVIAAFGKDAIRERLLTLPLDRVTPNTITDRAKLEAQLEDARHAGVARTHEELEVGLDAIAAPVFGVDGEIVAALDVSGPSHRLRNRLDLDRLTREGAADLSRRLGYRGKRLETKWPDAFKRRLTEIKRTGERCPCIVGREYPSLLCSTGSHSPRGPYLEGIKG